jgi:hypothetical protein
VNDRTFQVGRVHVVSAAKDAGVEDAVYICVTGRTKSLTVHNGFTGLDALAFGLTRDGVARIVTYTEYGDPYNHGEVAANIAKKCDGFSTDVTDAVRAALTAEPW